MFYQRGHLLLYTTCHLMDASGELHQLQECVLVLIYGSALVDDLFISKK